MSRKPKTTATKKAAMPARVPKLRFPEFRGEEGWAIEEVGDLLDESRTPSLLNDPSKRITVRLHLHGVEHREHRGTESTESTNNFCRKAGQFIYGKQNIHKGAFGIIPKQLDGFETSQDLPCFDFSSRCCPQWFYNNFASESVYARLELKMTGTGSKRLNEKTFLSLPIAVPLPPEQQKIAECLSSVDELIAAQARKVDALKTHKKGLMQQLFPREGETQPRLRFPEFRDAGEWEASPLIGLSSVGLSNGVFNDPKKVGTGYKLINVSDMYIETTIDESRLALLELSPSEFEGNQVINGDIFFTRSSLVKSGIAVSNIYLGSSHDVTYDGHLIRFRANTSKVITLFAHYLFKAAPIRAQLIARGKTATMTTIGQADVASVTLFYPEVDEQQRIADCLGSLDALITAETQKLEALKTHKKGLMQQLFPSPEEVEP